MSTYQIQSLNSLNIHKNFVDPVSGDLSPWTLVIQAYNQQAQSTAIVTHSFFNKSLDLKIEGKSDGTYELRVNELPATASFAHELTLRTSSPSYQIGQDDAGQPMLHVIGGVDMVAYLQGTRYDFPIEQAFISLKASGDPGDSQLTHTIGYAVMS